MKHISITAMVALLFISLNQSQAMANDAMELQMFVEEEIEIIDKQGNRSLKRVAAENIIPSDTIVYSTRYQNNGKEAADNVVITNIIPQEVTYLPGSAQGAKHITYSIDGGKHFDQEENLYIMTRDGKNRPATTKDYSHIRWLIPHVNSGKTGSVSFLSKVNED